MGAWTDITNQRFTRLVAIRYEPKSGLRASGWICRCDCGEEKFVSTGHLRHGKIRSCGCLASDMTSARNRRSIKHGAYGTPEYRSWQGIIERCCNPKGKAYSYYGGRGIKVCGQWRYSFTQFLEDIGPRPAVGFTVDRIDNNGNYEPGNVRWATSFQQANNRRSNGNFSLFGVTKTISQWARELSIPKSSLRTKLRKGITLEELVA